MEVNKLADGTVNVILLLNIVSIALFLIAFIRMIKYIWRDDAYDQRRRSFMIKGIMIDKKCLRNDLIVTIVGLTITLILDVYLCYER